MGVSRGTGKVALFGCWRRSADACDKALPTPDGCHHDARVHANTGGMRIGATAKSAMQLVEEKTPEEKQEKTKMRRPRER